MSRIGLFIDSLDPGGAESVVFDLAAALSSRGYEATIFHFGNEWLVRRASSASIDHVVLGNEELYGSTVTLPAFSARFSRQLRRGGIDLLHSHLYGAAIGGALAARYAGIPHVATLHDRYTLEEHRTRAPLLQLAALLGTHLCAVSDDVRECFRELSRFYHPHVSVVYNGVAVSPLGSTRAETRARLGIPPDALVVCCVARLVRLKRFDVLLRAVREVRQSLPRMRLLIVGEGPEEAAIRGLSDREGLSPAVAMLGFRDDVREVLSASDVFVMASDTEGLSRSIAEAMLAGLPVVATDVGGNRELVTPGESGYLVRPRDSHEMASRILCLANHPDRRAAMGTFGMRFAARHFSLSHMLDSYESIYRSLGVSS